MPWGRVDDTYYDHPKLDHVETLHGPMMRLAAAGLNALAWSYCNRFLTDGLIVSRALPKLGAEDEVVTALVEVELWDEVAGGYVVHDFLDHNDSRAVILERREKEAKRKADWRAGRVDKSSPSGTHDDVAHDVPQGQANSPAVSPAGTGRGTRARAPEGVYARPRAHSRPVPSRPVENEKVPSPLSTRATNGAEPTLSKAELDAWDSFGPEWAAFRLAWIHRGFRLPPAGNPDDDDTSQRGLLFQIIDARPADLVRWVNEAPKSAKDPRDVITYVLQRWHEMRVEAGVEDEPGEAAGPSKGEAMESLADIIAGL